MLQILRDRWAPDDHSHKYYARSHYSEACIVPCGMNEKISYNKFSKRDMPPNPSSQKGREFWSPYQLSIWSYLLSLYHIYLFSDFLTQWIITISNKAYDTKLSIRWFQLISLSSCSVNVLSSISVRLFMPFLSLLFSISLNLCVSSIYWKKYMMVY